MTSEEIKKNLIKGDGIRIANKCKRYGINTNSRYVMFLLNNRRELPKRGKASIIFKVAEVIAIENKRDSLL